MFLPTPGRMLGLRPWSGLLHDEAIENCQKRQLLTKEFKSRLRKDIEAKETNGHSKYEAALYKVKTFS